MNWMCNHPEADKDFGDTDQCCIMGCFDEEKCTQPAGMIANMHSTLHPIQMTLMGTFNNLSDDCDYNIEDKCTHADSKFVTCCVAGCGLKEVYHG